MKILLIEDERSVAHVLSQALIEAGWSVSWASEGVHGLEAALKDEYAIVLLDLMLPGQSGWEVLQRLRAAKPLQPIFLITALDAVEDRVRGLQYGADDYLVKPFELSELIARMEALIRRSSVNKDLVTRVADLEVDRKTRTVKRAGRVIHLTRREYDLLEALASNAGLPVDRETLQRRVWTDDEAFEKTVDIFAVTLKRKIDVGFGQDLLHRNRNGEYMLAAKDQAIPDPIRTAVCA